MTYLWWDNDNVFWNIQLDIVGFLAILGEASVLANGQVAALSKTCLLPRLIPAPQALIRTSRPERLHPATGTVVGAHSGNIRRHVNHIPHILHQVAFHQWKLGSAEPGAYHVRQIEIKWARGLSEEEKNIDTAVTKAADRSKARSSHAASARTRSWGPLIFLAYAGCLLSIALLVMSIVQSDGASLIAVILLSCCSSLVGLASHWTLKLPTRTNMRDDIPPSDVIISYPNGSFLVVTCVEEIARLYFQSEQCDYFIKSRWQYRTISLLSSMCLMFGVIMLANATPLLQVMWGAGYIMLNAAYWIVAALPARWHWDMSSFEASYQEFEWYRYSKDGKDVDGNTIYKENLYKGWTHQQDSNFTEALWKTIGLTKNSRWARVGEIAPDTAGWDTWLKNAMAEARSHTSPVITRHPQAEVFHKSIDGDGTSSAIATDEKNDSDADIKKRGGTSEPVIDPESQINVRSRKVHEQPKPIILLPRWNYNQALTDCLKKHNRETW